MIVAGVMSGTSADGIDVAMVRVTGHGFNVRLELLGHQHLAYPKPVRDAVLHAMNAGQTSVAELSRLNFLLGELYAEAVLRAMRSTGVRKLELVGCHGQTIYHQGEPASYLGRKVACTWQTGEGSAIAARLGVPVVSDFRPADVAAGGKGAPLVPFLDYVLFRDRRVGRIAQNIGGIANLTAVPAGASPEEVMAFDTGPGNMVVDQLMQMLFNKPFDRNGSVARRGAALKVVLEECLRHPYFRKKPPKTAGREEFGREYAREFLARCGRAAKEDVIATATALTAHSIAEAIKRFVLPGGKYRDYIVSGGGTQNSTLMDMVEKQIAGAGLTLRRADDFGVPSQAKEAVAFAVLAYQTWRRQPGNIPSATGAKRPAVLGKISYV
ncbi:MAG TPA: anhydro-N-acetylmuramic acid kinase [Candidatus Limnocylindrales bacterium]|nr:anhydro-N-acetylmuramic acid kinase [Candidatus Limnocylindrales bacterium]